MAINTTNSEAGDESWGVNFDDVELVDVVEDLNKPPEKKPRMTKKRIELIKKTDAATSYIQQWCVNLGYEFSLMNETTLKQMIAVFVRATAKSEVNKALYTYYNSLPPVEALTAESFKSLDESLIMKVDGKTAKAIEDQTGQIARAKSNIASHERNVRDYERALSEQKQNIDAYTKRIVDYEAKIADLRSKSKTNIPVENYDNMVKMLAQLKGFLAELVNNSNFYKVQSMEIPDDGLFYKLKIMFETTEVYIKDDTAAAAFNLGSFLVEWKPFAYTQDNGGAPRSGRGNGLYAYIRVLPYKNNTNYQRYYHPHVSDSHVCWGNIQEMVDNNLLYDNNYKFLGNPVLAFTGLRELLKTYNAASPYVSLMKIRLVKDPKFYLTLEQVYKEYDSVTLSLTKTWESPYYSANTNNFDYVKKINPVSIRKYLNARGGSTSPELTREHAAIQCKVYSKFYADTDIQHRDAKGKLYLKLADNTFVEYIRG